MNATTFATLILTLLFIFSVKAHPEVAGGRSVPSAKQISADVFSCDSSDELLNAICQVGLRRVNSELEAAGIGINRNGILFTYDNSEDKKINTGRRCTVTAKVKHQHFSARLSSSSRLDFSGDSLIEPFAIFLKLPVSLSGKIDVKQRFGAGLPFGGCAHYASDSYSLKGSLSTSATVVIGLSLNPSLGVIESGDYGLVIQPQLAVLTKLRNTDIRFHLSGVNPITPVWTFIAGLSSTILKTVNAIFSGDSISDIREGTSDALAFDLGAPIILGVGALPRALEEAVYHHLLLPNYVEHVVEKRAKGFGPDLEEKLQADLKRSLKLDDEGKRVFIIKRNVMKILRSAGISANVFIEPPTDPSIACYERARAPCSSSNLHVIYTQCTPLRRSCDALRREHSKKFKPPTLIPSKPKIASRPTAAPTPTPRSPARPCSGEARRVCIQCRGCQRCQDMLSRCSSS